MGIESCHPLTEWGRYGMCTADTTFERVRRYYKYEAEVERPLSDKSFTRQEIQQLFSIYEPWHKWGVIWRLMYETGMRPIELCHLHLDNFDFGDGILCYKVFKPRKKKKGDFYVKRYKSRIVNLSDQCVAVVKQYIDLNKHSFIYGFIFPHLKDRHKIVMHTRTLNNEFDRLRPILGGRFLDFESNGCHLLSPKSFRITAISVCSEVLGVDKTSKYFCHEDPRVTLRYVRPANDLDCLKAQHCLNVVSNCCVVAADQSFLC